MDENMTAGMIGTFNSAHTFFRMSINSTENHCDVRHQQGLDMRDVTHCRVCLTSKMATVGGPNLDTTPPLRGTDLSRAAAPSCLIKAFK